MPLFPARRLSAQPHRAVFLSGVGETALERFPVNALGKRSSSLKLVAFSDGKPVTTFPENALSGRIPTPHSLPA
jgi:hypothetical protein